MNNICNGCGRFPFCENAPKEKCKDWIKREVEMKFVKKDENGNFDFERI